MAHSLLATSLGVHLVEALDAGRRRVAIDLDRLRGGAGVADSAAGLAEHQVRRIGDHRGEVRIDAATVIGRGRAWPAIAVGERAARHIGGGGEGRAGGKEGDQEIAGGGHRNVPLPDAQKLKPGAAELDGCGCAGRTAAWACRSGAGAAGTGTGAALPIAGAAVGTAMVGIGRRIPAGLCSLLFRNTRSSVPALRILSVGRAI